MSWWDRWLSFVLGPPLIESSVRMNIEPLFRWRGLGKGAQAIGTKNREVFSCSNGIKETRAYLINTISISFINNLNRPRM